MLSRTLLHLRKDHVGRMWCAYRERTGAGSGRAVVSWASGHHRLAGRWAVNNSRPAGSSGRSQRQNFVCFQAGQGATTMGVPL